MRRARPAPGGEALFAYGTLLFPEVMATVSGRAGPWTDAVLPGYARRALRGRGYPGILPCPGARVAGRLWSGLTGEALDRLDRFEGDLYRRERVRVQTGAGERDAYAYVLRAGRRWMATAEDWDPEAARAAVLGAWAGERGRA